MKKNEQKKTSGVSEKQSKTKRNGSYSKNKGNRYEQQIAKELRELGYTGVKTSRSESKAVDNNKVDIIDTENKLPLQIQLKKTQKIPSFFDIRKQSTVNPEEFCIIWAKQEQRDKNIITTGEVALIDKKMLYKLLENYLQHLK